MMKNILGTLGFLGAAVIAVPLWIDYAGSLPAGRYPVILLALFYLVPPLLGAAAVAGVCFLIGAAMDAPGERRHNESRLKSYRGEVLYNEGKYAEAIQALTEVLQLEPNYEVAMYNRGLAHRKLGNLDAALADFSGAVRIDPRNVKAWYMRGDVHDSMGARDKALADYNEAIRLDPTYSPAYNDRGIVFLNAGDVDRALQDFEHALRLNPQSQAALQNRDVAREKKAAQQNRGKDVVKATGADGTVYDVHFDFARGPEAINSAACGREYWVSPDPNHRFHGIKFVYLVDRDRNRVVPTLFVERDDGSLEQCK